MLHSDMDTLQRPRFLSVAELAEELGVSDEHLYRLARQDKLPGMLPRHITGRRVIVNLERFLAAV